jgi:hypothetical protein
MYRSVNKFSILAIKSAPINVITGISSVIGHPEDYQHNKSHNSFPDSYDLRIPNKVRVDNPEV